MMPPKFFIKQELMLILNNLVSLFTTNELAFYSLQGKNELQIRDKVAWELQKRIDSTYGIGKYIVRKEWSKDYRSKVDVAILEVDPLNSNISNPIVMVEFKAQSFLNTENWPYAAFLEDVYKMYNMSSNEEDMYFIFLHSTQNHNQRIGGYRDAITYVNILNHPNTITTSSPNNLASVIKNMYQYWKGFYSDSTILGSLVKPSTTPPSAYAHYSKFVKTSGLSLSSSFPLIHYPNPNLTPNRPNLQLVGLYLGYEWYVAPFVWGPYKKDNSTTKALINLK